MAAIWLAMTAAALDGSAAIVALPTIARDLHTTPAASIWVVNGFQLGAIVSLLPLAALGEIVSYRRVFLGGLSLFILAALGCALSRDLTVLTAWRALEGIGVAGIVSVNAAVVRHTVPHERIGAVLGLNALIVALFGALGPSLAAAILSVATWPWLFAIHIPAGLAALAIGVRTLPDSLRSGHRLDLVDIALSVVALALLFLGAQRAAVQPRHPDGWLLLASGAVTVAALVRRSLAKPRPLIPLDLLRAPLFSLSILTSVVTFTAQMMAFIALPFYFVHVAGRTPAAAGLLMTPWSAAIVVAAPLAGRLADRCSAAVLGGVGLSVMAFGLAMLAALPAQPSSADIIWRMGLCGLGFGFFQAPNNRALMLAAPIGRAGGAAGMQAIARHTGQILGAIVVAALFAASRHAEVPALVLGAGSAALAAAASFSRLRQAQSNASRG